jgi:MoCo/4Fe-4S cofactor protein with predicted Tat translocation signal
MKQPTNQVKDVNYWKGFKDLHQDPEFIEASKNEFVHGVPDAPDATQMTGISRRKFMALLGASAALAGTACSPYQDRGKIIPYVNSKEGHIPGLANYYASTYALDGQAYGVLIKTREGRPIKIDGNPDHPFNKGKLPLQIQSSILDLYDPARVRKPRQATKSDLALFSGNLEDTSWENIDTSIRAALKEATANGQEVAVVTGPVTSPAYLQTLEDFKKAYPTTRVYNYSVFHKSAENSAWQTSFNAPKPLFDLNKADTIIGVGSDFLGNESNSIHYMRQFSGRRETVNGRSKFNRLYAIEANMSQTGMNADYRLRLNAGKYEAFVAALIQSIQSGNEGAVVAFAGENSLKEASVKALFADAKAGNCVIMAGENQSERLHLLVNQLNDLIGANALRNYDLVENELQPVSTNAELANLVAQMNAGKVACVILDNVNPVFDLPEDLGFTEALEKVPHRVTLTLLANETSRHTNYVLPVHHVYEAWGDASTFAGLFSLQQPVIQPIFDSRQKEGLLLAWSAAEDNAYNENLYHDYLQKYWQENVYPAANVSTDFKRFWTSALHDGVVKTTVRQTRLGKFAATIPAAKQATGDYELLIKKSYMIGDGRYANNGWLLETPHPVSKVTWDNYAAISLATAQKLGVENDDMVSVSNGTAEIKLPVFVQPGLADGSIVVEYGFGRTFSGPIAEGVGFNVNPFRSANDASSNSYFANVSIQKTDGLYELASTQEHHVINLEEIGELVEKRHLIHEMTVDEYDHHPKHIQEKRHKIFSIVDDWEYNGNKWAMAVDLNKCIGCSACVVGCNVENNIPVVGKDQVAKGREMQWMRIDRYYSGTPEDPRVSVQPMLCQHCDNAPCEVVCPVAATVHSPDGLNDMSYNRCVGTRYCANNCPYKVRRFNYFDFRVQVANGYYYEDSFQLLHNPEVTVRSRGVMEKCTFCVQRISEEKDNAKEDRREVDGTRVTVACQDACPTDAIVFGDANQQGTAFAPYLKHDLNYLVLEETNVRPNVNYIAKLRNTKTEDKA